MILETLLSWSDLIVFLILSAISIVVLSMNEIKQLQKIYVWFHLAIHLWPFGQFSLNLTDDLRYQWIYVNISFLGIILTSFLWFVISLFFTLRLNRLRTAITRLAILPPLVIAILISLNPWLYWFAEPIDGSYIYRSYGPLFWVLVCMAGTYVILGCLMLISSLRVRGGGLRNQTLLLVFAQLLLVTFWGADMILNLNSFVDKDILPGLSSLGIMLSYLCFAVAVQRYSTYKVVSLAHDTVIDSMDSGLVVLNDKNLVIDTNQTAKRFLALTTGHPFPIEHCIECMDPQDSEDFLHVYTNKPRATIQAELNSLTPTMRHVLMRIHPIIERGQVLGRMITFQDITDWRSMVEELNSKNRDLSARNKELTIIQEELYSANKKLELMATTDSLTGCYNRRYLLQMMEYQISVDNRYRVPFSIILLDIDFFKRTNDTYGHQIGDQVLKQTAEVIAKRLRKTDIFARYGGEEFAIFLPHTKHECAMMLAEELRSLVESNAIRTERGEITVTISVGIASSDEEDTFIEDVNEYIVEMIAKADAALYRAKHLGRNQIAASDQ